MVDQLVEKKLENVLSDMETRLRSYLEWCGSPAAKLLFLEFMELPGAEPTWWRGEPDSRGITTYSGGLLDSARNLPVLEAEGERWVPTGLVWLDSLIRYRVLFDKLKSECCRLVPKYDVKDDTTGEVVCTVDFAVFWPRVDHKGYIKIAIECDGTSQRNEEKQPSTSQADKRRKLQELGWIVARFSHSQICEQPTRVIEEIHGLAMDMNTHLVRERRCP